MGVGEGKGGWGRVGVDGGGFLEGAGKLPPLLPCKEAPSTNSGSPHTARSRQTEQFAKETSLPRTRTRRLNVFPEARTSESPFKPMGEQNPRLTRG